MKKKSNSQHVHMKKHCLKNRLRSGVALIVLVGWSSIASAQWTPLANAFPSGFAYSLPSPHRWHGDVSRVQHEPVASAEAGHQWQLSKWLVGCPGLYRRGHAKRQRPHYWMRELPVHAAVLRVGGAAGWTSGCHRRRIQRRSSRRGPTSGSCTIRWQTHGQRK